MFARSPRQRVQLGFALLAAVLLTVLPGCRRKRHHHDHGTGCGCGVILEAEPNDTPLSANVIGGIGVGSYFAIEGFVDDTGFDLEDRFAFTAVEPCDVEVVLTIHDPSADLDICIYDSFQGAEVFCFETGFNPEAGAFGAPGFGIDFQVVLFSFFDDSDYTLEVFGHPLGSVALTQSDAPARALGDALPQASAGGAGEPAGRAASVEVGLVVEIDGQGEVRATPFLPGRPID